MHETCPTCHRPWQPEKEKAYRKKCHKCGLPITLHHKWFITDDGKFEHRLCDRPEEYPKGVKG